MKFKRHLLSPSYSRQAGFSSLASQESSYRFECSACEAPITFLFSQLIGDVSWRDVYSADEAQQITSYFEMNIVGKSPDGGSPAILEINCASCGTYFIVYGGVMETSNSVYRVVVQGIAEIVRA